MVRELTVTATSTLCDLSEAPADVRELADYWHAKRGDRHFPARRDIDPVDLRPYLGNLCILTVVEAGSDFVFRLFGSKLADDIHPDFTGKSVRELRPEALAAAVHQQLEEPLSAAEPRYYRVDLTGSGFGFDYERLVLPLAEDRRTISDLLTYSRLNDVARRLWPRPTN